MSHLLYRFWIFMTNSFTYILFLNYFHVLTVYTCIKLYILVSPFMSPHLRSWQKHYPNEPYMLLLTLNASGSLTVHCLELSLTVMYARHRLRTPPTPWDLIRRSKAKGLTCFPTHDTAAASPLAVCAGTAVPSMSVTMEVGRWADGGMCQCNPSWRCVLKYATRTAHSKWLYSNNVREQSISNRILSS